MSSFEQNVIDNILSPDGLIKSGVKLALKLAKKQEKNSSLPEVYKDIIRIEKVCSLDLSDEYISLNIELTGKYQNIIANSEGILGFQEIKIIENYSLELQKCILLLIAYQLYLFVEKKQNPPVDLVSSLIEAGAEHVATTILDASFETITKD